MHYSNIDLTRRVFLWGLIKLEIDLVHFTPNNALINSLQSTDEALLGSEDRTCSHFSLFPNVPIPLKIWPFIPLRLTLFFPVPQPLGGLHWWTPPPE